MTNNSINRRKADHLRIVAEEDVAHFGSTLLECVELEHQALPDLALADIDLCTPFFGKRLAAPLMITSMTGGAKHAGQLNRALATAAGKLGLAFAVGSQRIMLEHPDTVEDFRVRPQLGDGVLLGNIGAVQLRDTPPARIAALAHDIEADGMCVHLNVAHELAQDSGDRDFHGLLGGIAALNDLLEGRVLVKETGAGLSRRVMELLAARGVRCIDVAGAGGTSWTRVESFRAEEPEARVIAETFADWGIPTACCLITARRVCPPDTCVIGAGGILTGLDAARAIACGADIAGVARGVLKAYMQDGEEGAEAYLRRVKHELACALLLCGAPSPAAMRQAPRVYTGKLREWLTARKWLASME